MAKLVGDVQVRDVRDGVAGVQRRANAIEVKGRQIAVDVRVAADVVRTRSERTNARLGEGSRYQQFT